MKLYNTLTKTIEEFKSREEGKVKLYTCGPTVYSWAHIGNLRCYVQEDILEKGLTYVGYKVDRVMNITDVGHLTSDGDTGEDKMLKGAKKEHKTVMEIAKMYTEAFFNDCAKINIKKPDTVIPATTCIDEYIKMIIKLLETGYAYLAGENVYFDTSKLKEYYVLTNNTEDDIKVGVRDDVEEDTNKKNKTDFVLWFTKSKFEDQDLKWNSPWGLGYPGWHIECSCISLKYLGEYLDIHCGGVDNIFPHHTNEIAQTESYVGHPWCHYWFHVEHLNDASGKMSKSKGEPLTMSLLENRGYSPLAYRLMCLQSHYRKPLVFSFDSLDNFQNTYNKLISKIRSIEPNNEELNNDAIKLFKDKFTSAVEDDLNTSLCLTVLYDLLKSDVNNNTKLYLIEDFDKLLSLDLLKKEEVDATFLEYINSKIEERKTAKMNKDFKLADEIRTELESKKVFIKDTREGTTFEIR